MSTTSTQITAADFDAATEHAKDAALSLYTLGVAAAVQHTRMRYAAAGEFLNAAGKGYGGPRSILPLDALAGLCDKRGVPDLSSVFWSNQTIDWSSATKPHATIPRWHSLQDKEAAEAKCRTWQNW